MKHVPSTLLLASLVVLPFAQAACSSSTAAAPGSPDTNKQPPPDTSQETWEDGKTIDSALVIEPGIAVTIAPGAKINIAAKATITVQGTLKASSADAHATLGDGTAAWGGIIVASGGTLALDGVDLKKAGIHVQGGNADAKYSNGTIDGINASAKVAPFTVDKSGKITVAHATIRNPGQQTEIKGSFTATYLDYDEKDTHAIWASDPSAVVSIEDSKFFSTGSGGKSGGPDFLNGYGAKTFHVAYTDVTNAHCGFHFESNLNADIDIDHVTVHGVTNGADIWGSNASGTKTIKNSNFIDSSEGLDVQDGSNGAFEVSNCFFSVTKGNPGFPGADVKQTSPASAQIADAHPR